MRHGADISNWTELDRFRADFLLATCDFVCIGLQDRIKARDFRDMLPGIELQYYVDLPGRDLTVPEPGSWVWIDIEPGCFQRAEDVRNEGTFQTQMGLRTAIYCNEPSLVPVFGDSTELADFGCPLIYADYRAPFWNTFRPFNGWTSPAAWQYTSAGFRFNRGSGIDALNADLLLAP